MGFQCKLTMDFSFDPDVIQSIAGGRSALEMRRLHILNLEAANSFLLSYGFDIHQDDDVRRLWHHHRRAIVLMQEKLGFAEAEIPDEVKAKMNIIPVPRLEDVLKHALVRAPEAITWDEHAEAEAMEAKEKDKTAARITAH